MADTQNLSERRRTQPPTTVADITANDEAAANRFITSLNATLQDPEFRNIWSYVQANPNAADLANNWLRAHNVTAPDGKILQVNPDSASFFRYGGGYGLDANGQLTTYGNMWSDLPGWQKAVIIGLGTAGVGSAFSGPAGAAGGGGAGAGGAAGGGAIPSTAISMGGGAGAGGAGAAGATTAGAGGWLATLGKYSTAAGQLGQLAGAISANRAKGRAAEAAANMDAYTAEQNAYDDAVRRNLQGLLMQTEMPSVTPPPSLAKYVATVDAGPRDPNAAATGKALVAGAADTLAHPPARFDPSTMNPQPNALDTFLNYAAYGGTALGVLGPYLPRGSSSSTTPTTTGTSSSNLARSTGTVMGDATYTPSVGSSRTSGTSFLTGTELPPYATPTTSTGLTYPTADPTMAGISFLPPTYQVPRAFSTTRQRIDPRATFLR